MRIAIAAFLMMLAGCAGQINADEIEIATTMCAPHGGILYILTDSPSTRCKDGQVVRYGGKIS